MKKESKKNYGSNGILKIPYFSLSICISIGLAVGVYFLNQEMKLGFDKSLTAYVALLGAVPTVYLWIIKERKKEEELKNKSQELRQVKISELNKVYVDAVSQFYNQESFLAGAYSLNGLIDDWINLSKDDENKDYYYTRIQQILGIILSKTEERKTNHLFKVLSSSIIFKMIDLKIGEKFDLRNFDLSNLNLEGINFFGYDLYNINFTESNLSNAILSEAILYGANLSKANLSEANLSYAIISEANLSNAILSEANLFGAILPEANLSEADLFTANLSEAILTNADLIGAGLFGANLFRANLSEANLSEAILFEANLSKANLSKADLTNADLSEADLSGADLSSVAMFDTKLDKAIFRNTKVDYKLLVIISKFEIKLELKGFLNNKGVTMRLLKNSKLLDIQNVQAFLEHLKKDYTSDMKFIKVEHLKLAYEKFSVKES
ncbi:pentapeptide repeat-containing protein [Lactococcus garvieae]|uniref:pentapeptide repeat-containing protein n=1 Tax=Lactococcus garvieae TaxID=1363 RepID=UPI003853BE63